MTNEMPKEAGEWWAYRQKEKPHDINVGHSFRYCDEAPLFVGYPGSAVGEMHFKHYDWHRIELPEGWR